MTQQQLDTRKERAETLVISRTDEGFRVYSPAHPTTSYIVSGSPEAPACTCLDFETHQNDREWRCKHILAVLEHVAKTGSCAPQTDSSEDEERAAIRQSDLPPGNRGSGSIPGTPQMVLKRSASPDGRIDSLSVEFSLPVDGETSHEVQARAEQILDLQSQVIESFLNRSSNGKPKAASNNGGNGAVPAQMLEIAGMNGKWGRRLFITVQANGDTLKLFGNEKQLAEAISAAGFPNFANRIAEGVKLNLPCLVTTKPSPDGKYTNIERVLSVPMPQPQAQPQRGWRQ